MHLLQSRTTQSCRDIDDTRRIHVGQDLGFSLESIAVARLRFDEWYEGIEFGNFLGGLGGG
ncbi:Protein of unknown function [Pyronema omphalodes CBS 100304]|uniref:Uncharacterized protein n=1 Tax=Pyronema omphalodes (strain CBS 100304) TaxID=1076935 RepID=U4L269_PYROM|nr:Protein of unknown function [Pyronema omphalodes CBS 100304]